MAWYDFKGNRSGRKRKSSAGNTDRSDRGSDRAKEDRDPYGHKSGYKKRDPDKPGQPYRATAAKYSRHPSKTVRGHDDPVPAKRASGKPESVPRSGKKPAPGYLDYEYIPKSTVPTAQKEAPHVPENIISGRNPIREALKAGRDLEKLLVQRGELSGSAGEIARLAREAHIPVQYVDKQALDALTRHHQGMIAFASAYAYSSLEAVLNNARTRNEDPFLILLDGITDPHNLGAIIRTAECVGAHGVIIPEHRSVGLTPAAFKASAGAAEHIPVVRVPNLHRTISDLKALDIWSYAVTMDGEDYRKPDYSGGTALVIGAEGDGLSKLTKELCDFSVSIPVNGHIDSLNASVAAGVVMYHVLSRKGR